VPLAELSLTLMSDFESGGSAARILGEPPNVNWCLGHKLQPVSEAKCKPRT